MSTIIRLSPSQAAQLFGVNERSIRRAINQSELRYIVVQGRYKINFEDLIKWSQSMPSRGRKRDEQGIGQYIEKWKIKNPKYSPSKKLVDVDKKNAETLVRPSGEKQDSVRKEEKK